MKYSEVCVPSVISRLILNGNDVNQTDEKRQSPLLYASIEVRPIEIFE